MLTVNFSMKFPFDHLKFPNSQKWEKLRRNWLDVLVILHKSLRFQLNSVLVILHLAGWIQIKYLHLIRWEIQSRPLQDIGLVHWRWSRVVQAQGCFWFFFKRNDEVHTKLWTMILKPINCRSCVFWLHLAQKRWHAFIIVERKDKRIGASVIATTGF